MEISNMINSKIKVMVIKILTGFEERKKKENIKKNHSEMKSLITKTKNALERINTGLEKAKE